MGMPDRHRRLASRPQQVIYSPLYIAENRCPQPVVSTAHDELQLSQGPWASGSPIPGALADSMLPSWTGADHPFRCRISRSVPVELLLTMGQLNRVLTCVVAVMAGYLGTYSAYVERSGLPWSLGSGGACVACGSHNRLLPPARTPHA